MAFVLTAEEIPNLPIHDNIAATKRCIISWSISRDLQARAAARGSRDFQFGRLNISQTLPGSFYSRPVERQNVTPRASKTSLPGKMQLPSPEDYKT